VTASSGPALGATKSATSSGAGSTASTSSDSSPISRLFPAGRPYPGLMGKDRIPQQPEDPHQDPGRRDQQPWTSGDANLQTGWQVEVVSAPVADSESRLSRAIEILLRAAARPRE